MNLLRFFFRLLYLPGIIFLSSLLLCGCKGYEGNCPDQIENRFYYLFDEEKNLAPYTGLDTLRFKHSSGAVYTFYGSGIDSSFSVQSTDVSPDCPDNILEHRQFIRIRFISDDYGRIEFKKYIPVYANANDMGNLAVSRDGVNQYSVISNYYKANTNNTTFFDSLTINNKTYYRVVTMPYNGNYTSTSKAYLNREYGILKIIISEAKNDVLERVPD